MYDNRIGPLTAEWSCSGGGDMDPATGELKARTVGKWTVKAKSGGIEGTAEVTITHGALETLLIKPKVCNLTAGAKDQFTVSGYDKFGNQIPDEKLIPEWTSDGGGVITETGEFTAVMAGSWHVTATCSGKTASADVYIVPGPIVKIDIDPTEYLMYIDETLTFNLKGYDIYNNLITDMPIDWHIPAGAGTIDNKYMYTPSHVGKWTITASTSTDVKKITAEATVTVEPREDTDSDSDGMPDVWELKHGLNPELAADAHTDLDSDNATNLAEYKNSTNPNAKDTDGDGLPDGWELNYNLDPLSTVGENGYDGDPDDDGYPNLGEYNINSDPRDPLDPEVEQNPETTKTTEDKESGSNILIPIIIVVIAIIMLFVIFYILFFKPKKPDEI
jgi:hypothetical protein